MSWPQMKDDQPAQSWAHFQLGARICMAGQRREQPATSQAAAAARLKPRRTASLVCCVLVRPLPGSHCSDGMPIRAAWFWRSGAASCNGGSHRYLQQDLTVAEVHAAGWSRRPCRSHEA